MNLRIVGHSQDHVNQWVVGFTRLFSNQNHLESFAPDAGLVRRRLARRPTPSGTSRPAFFIYWRRLLMNRFFCLHPPRPALNNLPATETDRAR